MPHCPKCGYEYREGIDRCPECGEVLAPGPSPEKEFQAGPGPVPLAIFPDPAEAMVVRAALQEAGMPVTMQTHGPITGELAAVTEDLTEDYAVLFVPADRLTEAQQLLEALRREPPAWPPGMEPEEGE